MKINIIHLYEITYNIFVIFTANAYLNESKSILSIIIF